MVLFTRKMDSRKCLCAIQLVVLILISVHLSEIDGLRCYTCDSHVDPDCIEQQNESLTKVVNCSDFITDLSLSSLRCVRIVSSIDVRGEVVIRRCAVVGDCKYIAKNEKQSCHECVHDLCNTGK